MYVHNSSFHSFLQLFRFTAVLYNITVLSLSPLMHPHFDAILHNGRYNFFLMVITRKCERIIFENYENKMADQIWCLKHKSLALYQSNCLYINQRGGTRKRSIKNPQKTVDLFQGQNSGYARYTSASEGGDIREEGSQIKNINTSA